jgi:hypothetical protein
MYNKSTRAFFKALAFKEVAKQIKYLKAMLRRITNQANIEKEYINHYKMVFQT